MSFQFLVSGFLAAICTATLCGMPDPDLFDGRYSPVPADTSATGNETNESGKVSEGNENADGRNESSSAAAAGEEGAKLTNGKSSGSGNPGSKSSSSESTISEAGSTRSFEEFEIGSFDETKGKIEINRSKELGETSPASRSSNQTANTDSQNSDENPRKSSAGNQETFDGSGSVDYGENVPFGL
jgi:hypothetical protein